MKHLKSLIWLLLLLVGSVPAFSQAETSFLSAVGFRDGTGVDYRGSYGVYWSSSFDSDFCDRTCSLFFGSDDYETSLFDRFSGQSVRPVSE